MEKINIIANAISKTNGEIQLSTEFNSQKTLTTIILEFKYSSS